MEETTLYTIRLWTEEDPFVYEDIQALEILETPEDYLVKLPVGYPYQWKAIPKHGIRVIKIINREEIQWIKNT